MKAFVYEAAHLLDDFAIELREVADPITRTGDILVRVAAFSVNPVDTKVRQTRSARTGECVILGWDAAGVVEWVGPEVEGFRPGDKVFYAGDISRQGSYAQFQAVDHRLVSHMPASLTFADAAAMPLTSLTACEALFERGVKYDTDTIVLVTGGAGGVGSMALQLLKALTPATVIAMASRGKSIEWARSMGADEVIGRDIRGGLQGLDITALDVVFGTTHTGDYLGTLPDLMRPFGHLMTIDDPRPFDIAAFKTKAVSVHWEYMFAKALHGFREESQGAILRAVSDLVDGGQVRTTCRHLFAATPDQLRDAHAVLEEGTSIGKIVFEW